MRRPEVWALVAGLLLAVPIRILVLRATPAKLRTRNYRGAEVRIAGGMYLVVLWGTAIALTAGSAAIWDGPSALSSGAWRVPAEAGGIAVLIGGFFALGMLDDLVPDSANKGLGGHLRALLRGRLTTGAVKAAGGVALGCAVGWWWRGSVVGALVDGALISLGANMLNLLDLRPGRAVKSYLPLWTLIAVASAGTAWLGLSVPVTVGAFVWLRPDLREAGMLGDSGANLLGAVLGAGAALALPMPGRTGVVVGLVVLTLASERWSFSRVIEQNPILSYLDGLGRR